MLHCPQTDAYEQQKTKRLFDIIKYDLEKLRFTAVDTEDHAEWRRRTRVANPSPEGFTA